MTRRDPTSPGYRFGWIVIALCCLGLAAYAGAVLDVHQAATQHTGK